MIKYKIMYIRSTLQKAGPTNQLFYLLKFLDKNIFDPIIVTLSPEPHNSSYKRFKDLGIKVESLNLSRIKGFFLTEKRLNSLVKKYKPYIIQTHGFRADRVKIKNKIASRIITLRTSFKQAVPLQIKFYYLGKLLADFLYISHIVMVKKSEFVVACSKSLSTVLYNKYGVNSIYIQNGVDTHKYTPVSEKMKRKIKGELEFPENTKVYISVGSLIPMKNTGAIIELFKRWSFLNNSMLIILGKGMEYNKYKKNINNYENIRLLGEKQDVRKYLQASDYFISASKGEGLPNAVLEAMSSGLPCILSDIAPHQEILKSSKMLGVLFKNSDNQDLMKKILQINNTNYDFISSNCRKHIQKNFSAKIMSFGYQKLYTEILNVS